MGWNCRHNSSAISPSTRAAAARKAGGAARPLKAQGLLRAQGGAAKAKARACLWEPLLLLGLSGLPKAGAHPAGRPDRRQPCRLPGAPARQRAGADWELLLASPRRKLAPGQGRARPGCRGADGQAELQARAKAASGDRASPNALASQLPLLRLPAAGQKPRRDWHSVGMGGRPQGGWETSLLYPPSPPPCPSFLSLLLTLPHLHANPLPFCLSLSLSLLYYFLLLCLPSLLPHPPASSFPIRSVPFGPSSLALGCEDFF